MKTKLNCKILITGGGSGGHISPAVAILEGLHSRYEISKDQLLYLGGRLGMSGEKEAVSVEERIISPREDINYISIRAGKLQRRFDRHFFNSLAGVFGGTIDALKEVKRFKPDIIISTGGYVTVPVCFAGWILGKPIYLHEQTAAIGLTNKIASKFAKRIYTSFIESENFLPKEKVLHVGNAVRSKVFDTSGQGELVTEVDNAMANGKPLLLFMGGGQGSHLINEHVALIIPTILDRFNILIQTGDNKVLKDYDKLSEIKNSLSLEVQKQLIITKFIDSDQIGAVFNKSSIFIGRAGANSVYEMSVLRKPSIFIPIPWVTHNEQYKNAKTYADTGLAMIIEEKYLTSDLLLNTIISLHEKLINSEIVVDEKVLNKRFPKDAVERILDDLKLESLTDES